MCPHFISEFFLVEKNAQVVPLQADHPPTGQFRVARTGGTSVATGFRPVPRRLSRRNVWCNWGVSRMQATKRVVRSAIAGHDSMIPGGGLQ